MANSVSVSVDAMQTSAAFFVLYRAASSSTVRRYMDALELSTNISTFLRTAGLQGRSMCCRFTTGVRYLFKFDIRGEIFVAGFQQERNILLQVYNWGHVFVADLQQGRSRCYAFTAGAKFSLQVYNRGDVFVVSSQQGRSLPMWGSFVAAAKYVGQVL